MKPDQVTLVPDKPHVITSNVGWDTLEDFAFLRSIVLELQSIGTRVSIFVNPSSQMIHGAKEIGANRIELFTEPYAHQFSVNRNQAIEPYQQAALVAHQLGLGINAGHDLNLQNLSFFYQSIPYLDEVSIGHALVCDALYFGLENTIQLYRKQLE